MKRKCDQCDQPATHHSVEIIKGQKIEKHLCDEHAVAAGLAIKTPHMPINQLLTNFVKQHSGIVEQPALLCDHCGLSFAEFREHSLLGCPACYTAFDAQLSPLIERAQGGGTHHIGKAPRRAGGGEQHQQRLLRLRKRLAEAVAAEDYEQAARFRDEIRRCEGESA